MLLSRKNQRLHNRTRRMKKSIFNKDSADYSASFLNEMERLGAKNIALVDSFMILGNTDTIRFPQEPRIGERIVLTARKDHLAIALTVKRLNQTAIDYKVELVEFGNANYTTRGQAEISLYDYVSSQTGLKDEANWSDFPAAFDHLQDTCYLQHYARSTSRSRTAFGSEDQQKL